MPIDQTAIRDERRGNKYAGVEVLIDTAAHAAVQNRILQGLSRRQTPCREVSRRSEQRTSALSRILNGNPDW